MASSSYKDSSFYGSPGHWNFLNTMFDLFLAGSETTSTFLTYVLVYCLNFPGDQKRVQGGNSAGFLAQKQP